MTIDRRRFLSAVTASPVALGTAASSSADTATEGAFIARPSGPFETGIFHVSATPRSGLATQHLWDLIMSADMPEWKQLELWEEAQASRCLDPDIASMRSISGTTKLRV